MFEFDDGIVEKEVSEENNRTEVAQMINNKTEQVVFYKKQKFYTNREFGKVRP